MRNSVCVFERDRETEKRERENECWKERKL
jgi:hypothetical protein